PSDLAGDRDVTGRVLARLHPAAGIVAVVVGLGGGISVAIANAVTVAVAGRAGPRVAAAEGVEVLVVVVGARAAREQQRERHEFEAKFKQARHHDAHGRPRSPRLSRSSQVSGLADVDLADRDLCLAEHRLADAKVLGPALGDLERAGEHDLGDAGLDQRARTAGAWRPRDVSRAALERHADPGGVHDRVLLGVADQRVLELAVAEPPGGVLDPAREPVASGARALAVGADDHAAGLRRRILAPVGDVVGEGEEAAVPLDAHRRAVSPIALVGPSRVRLGQLVAARPRRAARAWHARRIG